MSIHPTALVDPSAELGAGVEVGPFALVERDVRIGDGCVIGPRASILRYTTLGRECRVHTGAVIGDWPQDLAFQDHPSFVRVGDRCVIREYVTIHRGTKEGTTTVVGNQCFLMAMAHLAHNVTLGNGVILANAALLGGYVEVGDRAFISGNVLIHQFTRIGRLAMLGGATGLSQDVPPFCTTRPMLVNQVMGLNVVGMRRAGFTPEDRVTVKRAFRILYREGLNFREAVARIRTELPGAGVAEEMAAFVASSHRGICRLVGTGEEPGEGG